MSRIPYLSNHAANYNGVPLATTPPNTATAMHTQAPLTAQFRNQKMAPALKAAAWQRALQG